jgi:hypothetical protein
MYGRRITAFAGRHFKDFDGVAKNYRVFPIVVTFVTAVSWVRHGGK